MYEFIDAEYAAVAADKAPAPISQMCAWLGISKSGFYHWRSRPESATAQRRAELRLLIGHLFKESDGTYGYRRIAAQLARSGIAAGAELVRQLMRELGLIACQPRPWRPATTAQGLITAAIEMAARNMNLPADAVFHSDRGSNYTSSEFAAVLKGLGIRQSVGRTGICFDNALAESFNAAVKVERVHRTVYPTRKRAADDIAQ
jgi:transposase InsO family protein